MSDFLTEEQLEAIKQRDGRFRLIELGISLEAELARGQPLAILLDRLRKDAEEAMEEFSQVNCGDTKAVQDLQSRVFRYRYAKETFELIIARGHEASRAVQAEDRIDGGY